MHFFLILFYLFIYSNRKATCEVCGRNPAQHGVRLQTLIATNGQPDSHGLDKMITGFELEHGLVCKCINV